MTMKTPQIVSIIVLFIISLGLSGTASQAGEIDDLRKRLLFLEAQKEIVSKLDSMQSNIDGLRGTIDGFQKELDDFRVQYDLKASETNISNKNENTKTTKSNAKTNIYEYTWSGTVCDRVDVRLKVIMDTKKLGIKVTSLDSGETWTDGIILKNDKYTFQLDVAAGEYIVEFSGYALPSGGLASLYYSSGGCDGDAKLVPVKN